jgi:hypothetical protein
MLNAEHIKYMCEEVWGSSKKSPKVLKGRKGGRGQIHSNLVLMTPPLPTPPPLQPPHTSRTRTGQFYGKQGRKMGSWTGDGKMNFKNGLWYSIFVAF